MTTGPGWGGRKVQQLRALVVAEYGTTCWLCGRPIEGEQVTLDHVVPRVNGGSDEVSNLRPSHARCNFRRNRRAPVATPSTTREW